MTLRLDFTSNLVHRLAFETPILYISPYGKINHGLDNLIYNCDMKSGLTVKTAIIQGCEGAPVAQGLSAGLLI